VEVSNQPAHETIRNVYKLLIRNPEGRRPIGSTSYKWDDNNKVELEEK
jgi:hypothetical protein